MKSIGIVRNLDNLGRIVIPKEMRKILEIADRDPVEMLIEGDAIVLRKYKPSDVFTGSTEDLIEYRDKMVSKKSIEEMAKLAGII